MQKIYCLFCNDQFGCYGAYLEHLRTEHAVDYINTHLQELKCLICDDNNILEGNPQDIIEHLAAHLDVTIMLYKCTHCKTRELVSIFLVSF